MSGWKARSLNCHHLPVSLVGRFRLGGQVLLGIENLSLALHIMSRECQKFQLRALAGRFGYQMQWWAGMI